MEHLELKNVSRTLIIWKHLALHNAFLLSGISEQDWISIGQEQVFMLLGFGSDFLNTFTGIILSGSWSGGSEICRENLTGGGMH